MSEITITITADEDDLRRFRNHYGGRSAGPGTCACLPPIAAAIAAGLPKPRIIVKPGMVLRASGYPHDPKRMGIVGPDLIVRFYDGGEWDTPLDPDEWTVIFDAEES